MLPTLIVLTQLSAGLGNGFVWEVTVKHHETNSAETFELTTGHRRLPFGDDAWCDVTVQRPKVPSAWLSGGTQTVLITCQRGPSLRLRNQVEEAVSDPKLRESMLDAATFKVGTGGFCALELRRKVFGLHVSFGEGRTYRVKAECL